MQLKNGRLEVLELLALFLLKTETCDAKNSWEFFVDAIFGLVKIGFEKRRTNRKSSLMNGKSLTLPRIQHKVVPLVLRNCISRRFLITQFLAAEALGKNTLANSGGSFLLFVRQLSQMCYPCILRLNLTSYLCSDFYGHDWFQTCRYKTRELWGLFAEEKILSYGFEIIDIFCKNAVLNICQYLNIFTPTRE